MKMPRKFLPVGWLPKQPFCPFFEKAQGVRLQGIWIPPEDFFHARVIVSGQKMVLVSYPSLLRILSTSSLVCLPRTT